MARQLLIGWFLSRVDSNRFSMRRSDHKRRISNAPSITVYTNQPESIQAESLYMAHYPQVRAFLMMRSQSPDVVEEVLQEVYLKLMRIDDLSQIENPGSFLIRVAHNLLIDALRRQSREERRRSVDRTNRRS